MPTWLAILVAWALLQAMLAPAIGRLLARRSAEIPVRSSDDQ